MIKGIDISHHNKNMKDPYAINKYDFVIMKASEGRNYRDPALSYYMMHLDPDHLKGFYHYARPEINLDPRAEASNFVTSILKYVDDKSIVALDVEGAALDVKMLDAWCKCWCEYVYNALGKIPLIYTSEAYTKLFDKTASYGCGLWCAKWSNNKPKKIKPWEFFAIWQKTNNEIVSGVRCDLDYFNGTKEQFLKYCEVVK